MTEFEKELVRFVSGYLDAGVSAEDYVKAFSQRLLDSIGKQSKEQPEKWTKKDEKIIKADEELEKEIATWIPQHIKGGEEGRWKELRDVITKWGGIVARYFAKWGAEHLKK